jgi:hypothetical protein
VFIVLPMIMDMIDKWSHFPYNTQLKHLHPDQFQELLDMITIDHVEVKQRLKAASIKVMENWKAGSAALDYKIFVRRMEENIMFWKGHVKSEISIKMGEYVARLDKSKFIQVTELESILAPTKVSVDANLMVNFD